MVNLAQVIKGLRAARSRAQKEVGRLEKAIAALGRLDGKPERQARTGKKRTLSAAARKRISRAQKARWAKLHQEKTAKA